MDILKLIVVFAVIIGVLWKKKPMWMAVTAASLAAIVLYRLPISKTAQAFWRGGTAWTTLESLLVFYSITFLQRMMEKRRNLSNAQVALNGLFNNNRVNASIVPFMLGMLPAASTVLICGPIVRGAVKNSDLTVPKQASITSYYRHISESFLPTYTSIFIAIGITQGRVSAGAFILAMLPMVLALMAVGWIFYLRRVPKDTGMIPDQPRIYYWKLLGQSIWAIALTIILILVLGLPVWGAVWICIILNVFVNHFKIKELVPFFRSAFEPRLLVSTWLLMIFKELLTETGVIMKLPEFFSTLPIPVFMVFVLIFLFGTVVAGTQAMIVLCMPMAMEAVSAGHTGLALFTLLMCISYVAMQISPTHICLVMCAEDYKVPLGTMVSKTIPMVLLFTGIAVAYYGVLSLFGF